MYNHLFLCTVNHSTSSNKKSHIEFYLFFEPHLTVLGTYNHGYALSNFSWQARGPYGVVRIEPICMWPLYYPSGYNHCTHSYTISPVYSLFYLYHPLISLKTMGKKWKYFIISHFDQQKLRLHTLSYFTPFRSVL